MPILRSAVNTMMTNTKPEPSVVQMLKIGQAIGLTTVEQAWSDYSRHSDLYFNLEHYQEQVCDLWKQIRILGIVDMTISDALEKIKNLSSIEKSKKLFN